MNGAPSVGLESEKQKAIHGLMDGLRSLSNRFDVPGIRAMPVRLTRDKRFGGYL